MPRTSGKKRLSKDDMAWRILCIDPDNEPKRARETVQIYLACARWMTKISYH